MRRSLRPAAYQRLTDATALEPMDAERPAS